MLRSAFACFFSLSCLLSPALAQSSQNTPQRQTAIALRAVLPAVAEYEQVEALARLGDLEGATRVALRAEEPESKTSWLAEVAGYAARNALRNGQFDSAEKHIRSMNNDYGTVELWLELSRIYSQNKRPLDARRTTFYASSQVQRQKNTFGWPDVAWRLCEVGERAAARRLFGIAQKKLLDPDPLWGSPLDTVIVAAARCGFDDIAFQLKGSWAFGAVGVWAQQNRDDIARRFIDREVNAAIENLNKRGNEKNADAKSSPEITRAQAIKITRVFCLWPLAQGQVARGDIGAATRTWQEVDALVTGAEDESERFAFRVHTLNAYEALGQWDLADAILASLKAQLEEYKATTSSPKSKSLPATSISPPPPPSPEEMEGQLELAKLGGLSVIFHPERFGLEVRQAALERVAPRLVRLAKLYPHQSRYLLALARAQHTLGSEEWRTSLQSAQSQALTEAASTGDWTPVASVARQWRSIGEGEQSHLLGKQILKGWQAAPRKMSRDDVVRALVDCGLFKEASGLLVPRREIPEIDWQFAWTHLAEHWKTAPPKELLELDAKTRYIALQGWAMGLVPDESSKSEQQKSKEFWEPLL